MRPSPTENKRRLALTLTFLALAACAAPGSLDEEEGWQASNEQTVKGGGCSSVQLAGCERGMYVGLDATGVGRISFDSATQHHRHILGDEANEERLLSFAAQHGVRALTLYNLISILADEAKAKQLAAFMAKARGRGIRKIEAVGGASSGFWQQLAAFHQNNARFDGLVTEIEFWNDSASFETFLERLEAIRALDLRRADGEALPLAAYVGWFDAQQADLFIPKVDRVLIHAYVKNPKTAWRYVSQRARFIDAANQAHGAKVEIAPIFSAEGTEWAAGSEQFMGDWLAAGGSLEEAEHTFLLDRESESALQLRTSRMQYYSYFFLDRYLR